jgi:16S rRNA (guanine(527)-N(7))-methyltransferase RsmG
MREEAYPAANAGRLSAPDLVKLAGIASAVGSPLPDRFLALCESFLFELDKWNKRINLISTKDRTRIVERHVLDSLCLLAYENRLAGRHLLDVGPGAGFPGLVLAMWENRARFTLVESRSKPIAFLRAARRKLGLENVDVVHSRLEYAARQGKITGIDLVTSRAVGGTLQLAQQAAPLLKPGGAIVVYTARNPRRNPLPASEAQALVGLGLDAEFVIPPWQSLTTLLILRKLD